MVSGVAGWPGCCLQSWLSGNVFACGAECARKRGRSAGHELKERGKRGQCYIISHPFCLISRCTLSNPSKPRAMDKGDVVGSLKNLEAIGH